MIISGIFETSEQMTLALAFSITRILQCTHFYGFFVTDFLNHPAKIYVCLLLKYSVFLNFVPFCRDRLPSGSGLREQGRYKEQWKSPGFRTRRSVLCVEINIYGFHDIFLKLPRLGAINSGIAVWCEEK